MAVESVRRRRLRCEQLEVRRLLTVTIDTLDDVVDAADDVTSLREAIAAAEEGETIDFAVAGTIDLDPALGELQIDRSLSIEGPLEGEITINGSGSHRILRIESGDVALQRLTLTGGDAEDVGGGIFNLANLSVINSRITGNRALRGGGIYTLGGEVLVERSTVSDNIATSGFRGGGGIYSRSDFTLRDSTVSGNSASDGGGLLSRGPLAIETSTISGNSAGDSGGGVYVVEGDADVAFSTISGNTAGDSGGGFYNFNGAARIRYTTIANNEGRITRGGGVAGNGSLESRTTVQGSIIADNGDGGDMMGIGFFEDISDMFESLGHNVLGDGNVTDAMIDTDLLGIADAGLEPLADNGGPTLTHALREDSPAVDAGTPAAENGVGVIPLFDQRNAPFRRVFDATGGGAQRARIDIGAFELNFPADVSVTKSAGVIVGEEPIDSLAVNEQQSVVYTITASNSADSRTRATGVSVVDNLPEGLSFVSIDPSAGAYDDGVWSGFDLDPGESQMLRIEAIVATETAGSTLANTAVIAGNEVDPELSDNEATVMLTVNSTDLSVDKSVDDPTPNAEQEVVYTLVAANSDSSNTTATGVRVTDALPQAVVISAEATEGEFLDGDWSGLDLAPGESQTLQIRAVLYQTLPGETLVNEAVITGDQTDPDLSNNQDAAMVTLNSVDLAIDKSVDDATPNVEQQVVYTLVATNSDASNATATGVVVTDALPTEALFISAEATEGEFSGEVWSGLELAPGEQQTLSVTVSLAEASPGAAVVNTATISGDQSDPDLENNADEVSLLVNAVDLSIAKSAELFGLDGVQLILYTLTATNSSDSNAEATGVEVLDSLPDELLIASASPSAGSYDNGLWDGFELQPGQSATLVLEAEFDVGAVGLSITNTATIAGNESDPDPSNNSAEALIELPPVADLSVEKSVSDSSPTLGEQITYTVVAANSDASNVTATGVEVVDQLPNGVTLVSFEATEGDYDVSNGLWFGLALGPGESRELSIVVMVDSAGELITNEVSIVGNEPDPDLTNNSDAVDVTPLFPPISLTDAPVAGDFDQNGVVDGRDLADPQRGFAARFGDDLTGGDFLAWQRNHATASAVSIGSSTRYVGAIMIAVEDGDAESARQMFSPLEIASAPMAAESNDWRVTGRGDFAANIEPVELVKVVEEAPEVGLRHDDLFWERAEFPAPRRPNWDSAISDRVDVEAREAALELLALGRAEI